MTRLTKKINENRRRYKVITNADLYPNDYVVDDICIKTDSAIDKLGQYEDIDEKLGIKYPLLVKALREGVYYDDDGEILFSDDVKFYYDKKIDRYSLVIKGYTYVNVADYKETWALTKKDLVND